MNALMTGLGIGLAFWIVTIPSMLIIFRNSKSKIFETTNDQQERSLALMEERNVIDREVVGVLFHVVSAIDNNTERMKK